MPIGIDSWYAVTARSDQLIASISHESIVAELIRFDTNDLLDAASGACQRAKLLLLERDLLLAVAQSLIKHPPLNMSEICQITTPVLDVA